MSGPVPGRVDLARCLELALELGGGTHAPGDVVDALRTGQAQLWEAPGGFCVTELVVYPRAKALRLWLAGGRLSPLLRQVQPDLEAYAKDCGCAWLEASARAEWYRTALREGWTADGIAFRKRLAGG